MDITSTRFLSFTEINTDKIDIYDDAWGFSSEFSDVLKLLGQGEPAPANATARLIKLIGGNL